MIHSQIAELKAMAKELDKLWGMADKAVKDNEKFGVPTKDFVDTIVARKDRAIIDLILYIESINA